MQRARENGPRWRGPFFSIQVRTLGRCFAFALAAFACAPVPAHDLWIEPTAFMPRMGQDVGVRLRVGEKLVGDALLRDPALVRDFVYVDAAGRKTVAGRAGDDPAGSLQVAAAGLIVIGYGSHPSAVELPADRFNQYLKDEGLDAVIEARARRNETGAAVRERFARCAKSLLLTGPSSENQRDQVLGLALELVAERNPYHLRAGEDLPLRLTYQNQPLAGALVVAINSRDPSHRQAQRSGRDGRVRFQVQPGGLWLIKAVHMVRAPIMSKVDWTSYWASLTFGTPSPPDTNTKAKRG